MILTRPGTKTKIAKEIYQYFLPHKMRITLFFGAGGMFFNTPKAPYNIVNDLDDDVTNLFLVVLNQKEALYKQVELLPISEGLFNHWKKNAENDPLEKAIRFLLLSNFSYMGKRGTMRVGLDNAKENLLKKIESTFEALKDVKITTGDFRQVIPKISFTKKLITREESFVYLDPVYLDTEHTYKVPNWTQQDSFDCFEIMSNEGIPAAMSEFDHPFILEEAERRKFTIIPIKKRQNLKNKRQEILITNYWPQNLLF